MQLVYLYTTDFGSWVFDPEQFAEHMTDAARQAGAKAFGDLRFGVAKAVKAWAAEQDRRYIAGERKKP